METVPPYSSNDDSNKIRPVILAVDDNEDNLLLLLQVLTLLECSCISASDGQTTIFMAKTHQPDLILLDVMLPDLSGIEVIHQLRQDPQTMKIPIVAITALARTEDRDRLLSAGCNEYIKKPYVIEELEAMIRRYTFHI